MLTNCQHEICYLLLFYLLLTLPTNDVLQTAKFTFMLSHKFSTPLILWLYTRRYINTLKSCRSHVESSGAGTCGKSSVWRQSLTTRRPKSCQICGPPTPRKNKTQNRNPKNNEEIRLIILCVTHQMRNYPVGLTVRCEM